MNRIFRPSPFTILATGHGTMIVNCNDRHMTGPMEGFGVGMQLFQGGLFDPSEVDMALHLLRLRRACHGDGVVALDCGANIGVHTVEWARFMTGWGQVVAFEPQERIYYALAGNIAINNCFNARAVQAAVGAQSGVIQAPVLDYTVPSSFGSFEVKPAAVPQFIGQAVDYQDGPKADIQVIAIDDLGCDRLDFLKVDVEGMEAEALEGARRSIETLRPIMLVEHIKAQGSELQALIESLGYHCIMTPTNILAVHRSDPGLEAVLAPD
jgi:FkbM family methyltransferase